MLAKIKSISVRRRLAGKLSGFRGLGREQRGAALITALLMLLLITGLSSVMAISLNSDMMMNGYFGNFRSSLYAADSGLALVRQELLNQVNNSVNANYSATAAPISAGTNTQTILNNVLGEFSTASNSPVSIVPTVSSSAAYMPGQFYIDNSAGMTSLTLASCKMVGYTGGPCGTNVSGPGCTAGKTVTNTDGTCPVPNNASGYTGYIYTYDYKYVIRSVGMAQGTQKAAVREEGDIIFYLNTTETETLSFSYWGTFLNMSTQCNAELIGGTYTGPQFTNGSWTFGEDQSYQFVGPVSSNSSTIGYYCGSSSNCTGSSKLSYTCSDRHTIAPTFKAPVILSAPTISMPANDYSQSCAVLNSTGATCNGNNAPNCGNMYGVLLNVSKQGPCTSSTSSTISNGVYLPYTSVGGVNTLSGGGIWVQGDASVTMSTSGSSGQVYTIYQSSTNKTTTITVDNVANTTTISSGSTNTTISGVPQMCVGSCTSGTSNSATMLYVNGNVTSLSGPGGTNSSGRPNPAIQDGSAVTISAASNITVTDNVVYKTERTDLTNGNYIPANDNGQVLGIFTANGTVILNPKVNGQNLEIDAAIAATSTADSNQSSCDLNTICRGTISVADNQSNIGTLTIVGGRVQNRPQVMPSGTINSRNIIYDPGFSAGTAPPFFPATQVTGSGFQAYTVTPTINRRQWVSEMSY